MQNNRSSNLTVITMNSDLLKTLDYQQIIDIFAQKQRRSELTRDVCMHV